MNKEKEHSAFREDIVKYLAGEMAPAEAVVFKERLQKDADMKKLYTEYLQLWNGIEQIRQQERYDLDSEWGQLEKKIDFGDGRGVVSFRGYVVRIAAILLIGLAGISGFFIVRNITTFEKVAVDDVTDTFQLKDGSEVTLNYDSNIKYSMDVQKKRKVLLQGEAYFRVARDTLRPFVIEAGTALVEVLGTTFNVEAYKDRSTIEVTVHSGIVSMSLRGDNKNKLILKKNTKGVYYKNERRLELIEEANVNDFAWKTKELYFSQTPLSEVIEVINEAYHTDIRIANEDLASCPITVTFSNQELSSVLRVIVNTLDIEIQREGGNIILTGKGCQ